MSWQTLKLWEEEATVKHEALVCPMMVLWRSYVEYCDTWGFDKASPKDFVAWLRMTEGVEIKEGGSGRLRRIALGIGLRPKETIDAHHA